MAAPTVIPANETKNCAPKEVDIYRDTPIRYLGYANEVGEAFRALIPKSAVWATYGVASAYVLADARHKGQEAAKLNWPDDSTKKQKVVHAVGDTIVWQGLASVIIPGFTINRLCKLSFFTLSRVSSLPEPVRKWTTTALGLAVIPFIIKPIDKSVDYMMNNSVRRWYHIEPPEEKLVHHRR
ncbi:mitochondrial fission process protein 1 [Strongylocentrotus purpuratus]|uniref:Mitochondrial fission process protein 1 n=1 Tax=Strongylocentrotus purpuratus TaxID=7668 RepID=A0A7M7PDF7_STRPU|nr:mitochondrial fission process protein 1 [Strongylocentrotus purpuratus]